MRIELAEEFEERKSMKELCLCYDPARWDEAYRVAKRGGMIVANPNEGRGNDPAETGKWDTRAASWKKSGGKVLGYVDMLNPFGKRKSDAKIMQECSAWMGIPCYSGVWLDDVRDNIKDARLIRAVEDRFSPKIPIVIANPGACVKGTLRFSRCILCESESPMINFDSDVIIAFTTAEDAPGIQKQAMKSGVSYLALEPIETYHVPMVEYQKTNPLIP